MSAVTRTTLEKKHQRTKLVVQPQFSGVVMLTNVERMQYRSEIFALSDLLKGAMSRYFKSFLRWAKPQLSVGKPKTNGLLMKEKTKGVILKQKGTRMAEDGED